MARRRFFVVNSNSNYQTCPATVVSRADSRTVMLSSGQSKAGSSLPVQRGNSFKGAECFSEKKDEGGTYFDGE